MGFFEKAGAAGALSRKEKELIATAIAHVTECPYCIDIHTRQARDAGAGAEEVAEAILVAASVKAGGAVTHAANALNAYFGDGDDVLYRKGNLAQLKKLGELAPEPFNAAMAFFEKATAPGALSKRFKEIIAVAVAHVTECPYCIDIHTTEAKKAGATANQIAEAVLVAAATKAGGAVTHATHAFNVMDG